jgi:predicted PhzF superfamily epimerase YddE/YHI9/ribosomal protein S18 acetylase RimI-like enzyme
MDSNVAEDPSESVIDAVSIDDVMSRVKYRVATPTDIFQCFDMEKEAFSKEEAASKNDLRYRQHHAAPFFRCAVLEHDDEENDEDVVIGYISSTRCEPDEYDAYETAHQPEASSLMIHSMVVRKEYQRVGLGQHMTRNYIESVEEFNVTAENPISRVILFVKENFLTLYLHCGFSVIRPSRDVNGNAPLYLCEHNLRVPSFMSKSRHEGGLGGLDCYIVDSFAASPGTGNPAAVVLMPKETQPEAMAKWMHTVAAEFNLSETAFCWPSSDPHSTPSNEEHWNIRYYTPTVEIPLCGHATLASAAIIYQTLKRSPDYKIVFHAIDDDLIMEQAEAGEDSTAFRTRISMEFPLKPPQEVVTADDKLTIRMMVESAFSCELDPLYVGVSDIGDILIELKPASFHDIGYEKINFKALMEWHGYYRGVIICCLNDGPTDIGENGDSDSEPRADFLSRFFGPKAGINEDPVTGSAHCALAPYFAHKLGKNMVIGKQTSERGGFVECLLKEDTVLITGTAITTLTGRLWMKKGETILRPRITRERSSSMFEE